MSEYYSVDCTLELVESSDQPFRPLPGGEHSPVSPARPHAPHSSEPPPQPHLPRDPGLLKKLATPLVVLGAIALKFGAKLKLVFFLLVKVKFLASSLSMLVSIGAYSLIWGWQFAVGFVFLLLIHELGHVIQLRREGIEASAPMFIPFLGAVIAAKSLGDDAAAEARVGLAGPIVGSIAAVALVPVALITGNDLFMALAFVGFFLNLFNLLPIVPLDGGRAMAALHPAMWFVGLAAVVALMFVFPSFILVLVLILGGSEAWRRWKTRNDPDQEQYYRVSKRNRVLIGVTYLALAIALVVGMDLTYLDRDFGDA